VSQSNGLTVQESPLDPSHLPPRRLSCPRSWRTSWPGVTVIPISERGERVQVSVTSLPCHSQLARSICLVYYSVLRTTTARDDEVAPVACRGILALSWNILGRSWTVLEILGHSWTIGLVGSLETRRLDVNCWTLKGRDSLKPLRRNIVAGSFE
jgi:hypothetical protein